jgi:AraC-like DNA-binding protein
MAPIFLLATTVCLSSAGGKTLAQNAPTLEEIRKLPTDASMAREYGAGPGMPAEPLGGQPLSAIALEVGFTDQSHLTQVFRRATGMTPGRFRAALA